MDWVVKKIASAALPFALMAGTAEPADAASHAHKISHHAPAKKSAHHGLAKSKKPGGKNAVHTTAGVPSSVKQVEMMVNMKTGEIIGGPGANRNIDTRFNQASMTKLMTVYIALKEIKAGRLLRNERIDIPMVKFVSNRHEANRSDAIPYAMALKHGKSRPPVMAATVWNTLLSIQIGSSCRGPVAIANRIDYSEDKFVRRMNRMAAELGMVNTHYMNATGFPTPGEITGHYTTARDLLILMKHLQDEHHDEMKALNLPHAMLDGFDKNGPVKFYVKTHSGLMKDGASRAPQVTSVKTGFSKVNYFGSVETADIKTPKGVVTVGLIASGFISQGARDHAAKLRIEAAPRFLAAAEVEKGDSIFPAAPAPEPPVVMASIKPVMVAIARPTQLRGREATSEFPWTIAAIFGGMSLAGAASLPALRRKTARIAETAPASPRPPA